MSLSLWSRKVQIKINAPGEVGGTWTLLEHRSIGKCKCENHKMRFHASFCFVSLLFQNDLENITKSVTIMGHEQNITQFCSGSHEDIPEFSIGCFFLQVLLRKCFPLKKKSVQIWEDFAFQIVPLLLLREGYAQAGNGATTLSCLSFQQATRHRKGNVLPALATRRGAGHLLLKSTFHICDFKSSQGSVSKELL